MSHAQRVARFYAHGLERIGSFHDNYLNFGLWSDGVSSYPQAAEALLERVGERVGLGGDSHLLDVACGMGTQDRFFVERFGCARVEAFDLVPGHIAVARCRHALPNVRYGVADACHLPFAPECFTQVVAIEGIVHFDTRERFFREAHRVLRLGGRLGVADYFLARPLRTALERGLLRLCTAGWHVPPENVATLDEYRAALARAGFEDVRLEVVSDAVIPGYWREQRRAEVRRQVYSIRGAVAGRLAAAIDALMYGLYRAGVIGYLIASARKARTETRP
jgi:SAM-dependent methyltransferase